MVGDRCLGNDRQIVAGAVVAALRRPAAQPAWWPRPCGQHQRQWAPQAALRQARALRDVAAAALVPTVGSSASAQRSTAGGKSTGNSFQAGLDASWELDIFGANRSALAASEATAQASAASLGDVQVSIAAEVALDYIALRGAQARLAIASDNLASQQETLQITQWRLQAGLVTSLEAEQARAAAEQTARPGAGLADQHRADPPCAGGADRPAAGGLVDACWPRPARCRRRPTTWR